MIIFTHDLNLCGSIQNRVVFNLSSYYDKMYYNDDIHILGIDINVPQDINVVEYIYSPEFDMNYCNMIINNPNKFIAFMKIMTYCYQGTNVIILISHDEFRDAIVESLVKMIQLRYGYNSWILNTIDDLEYIKESDFTPEGLLVLDNDIITYQSMIMNNSNYNQ